MLSTTRYVEVIPLLSFKPCIAFRHLLEDLDMTGENNEVLGVRVAVQWDGKP
jgi:hypothetical protein